MKDMISRAPTVLFTTHPYPTLPTMHVIRDGDDIETLIANELGAETLEVKLEPAATSIGILRRLTSPDGDHELTVHSHPNAEFGLRGVIAGAKRMAADIEELRVSGKARFDKKGQPVCICGECDLPEDVVASAAELN